MKWIMAKKRALILGGGFPPFLSFRFSCSEHTRKTFVSVQSNAAHVRFPGQPAVMKTISLHSLMQGAYTLLIRAASTLKSPFLLVVRLYWGWQFFQTGTAKLGDIPTFTTRFTDWGVPLPHLSVILAGTTETVCGLLLLAGLASRLISIPLIFTMLVAYLTAETEALHAFFSDPDKSVSATPFQFMFAAILVLILGPGAFSIDYFFGRKCSAHAHGSSAQPAHA
jgi:putative oxidoreductase